MRLFRTAANQTYMALLLEQNKMETEIEMEMLAKCIGLTRNN